MLTLTTLVSFTIDVLSGFVEDFRTHHRRSLARV
jgi:hypothetical protein